MTKKQSRIIEGLKLKTCLAGFHHMLIVRGCGSTNLISQYCVSVSTIVFFMLKEHAMVYNTKGFVH